MELTKEIEVLLTLEGRRPGASVNQECCLIGGHCEGKLEVYVRREGRYQHLYSLLCKKHADQLANVVLFEYESNMQLTKEAEVLLLLDGKRPGISAKLRQCLAEGVGDGPCGGVLEIYFLSKYYQELYSLMCKKHSLRYDNMVLYGNF